MSSSPAPEPAKSSPPAGETQNPPAQPASGDSAPDSGQKSWTTRSTNIWRNPRFLGFVLFAIAFLIPFGITHGFDTLLWAIVTFLEVVLLFNILIIVHELGHFLAAKWCGLKIDKFAIWFGSPLWMKKVDGIEYVLGSIPAGGYVALPQMAPMEAIEGKSETPREELPPASPWQKIIVAFAGPLFSFLLALFFACIVWFIGKPVSYEEATTTIGYLEPKSPAMAAGLQLGDKILSIDNHPITKFFGMGDSVVWRVVTSTADTIPVKVQRGDQTLTVNVSPQKDLDHPHHWWERSSTRKMGVGPDNGPLIIKKLVPYGPAETAGLKPGDQLLDVNGQPIYSLGQVGVILKDHPHDPLTFTVRRPETAENHLPGDEWNTLNHRVPAGNLVNVTVTPVTPISPSPMPPDGPPTDLGFSDFEPGKINLVYDTPWQQVVDSVNAVVSTVSALFASHSNVGPSLLSGPVGIMNLLFNVLSSPLGWSYALWLAVLINVNLAMLNLLPLPVLDGGHIALSLVEWIRRRPLSMTILEPLQTACALVLIGYMVYITFYDLQDSGKMAFGSGGEVRFAHKATP
jgi:regulator of sigma E protease